MERVKGIEPSHEAWKASVLPLNYTRNSRSGSIAIQIILSIRLLKSFKPLGKFKIDEINWVVPDYGID